MSVQIPDRKCTADIYIGYEKDNQEATHTKKIHKHHTIMLCCNNNCIVPG